MASYVDTKPGVASSSLVVVVDPDAATQKALRGMLEPNGFCVQTASSGDEALRILRQAQPAVLILDTAVPGMSGYDLCHIVKRNGRLQHVPVLFLSSDGSPRAYRTGYDAGAAAFMVKPCKAEQLVAIVTSLASMPLPAGD